MHQGGVTCKAEVYSNSNSSHFVALKKPPEQVAFLMGIYCLLFIRVFSFVVGLCV